LSRLCNENQAFNTRFRVGLCDGLQQWTKLGFRFHDVSREVLLLYQFPCLLQ
jgi:hypothetical protein